MLMEEAADTPANRMTSANSSQMHLEGQITDDNVQNSADK